MPMNKHQSHTYERPANHQKREIPTNAGLYYYRENNTDKDSYGKNLPQYSIFDLLETQASFPVVNEIAYDDYFQIKDATETFVLRTHYPGLIIGIGYVHAVPEKNDLDFQQGFFFDWTTGVPLIPGSSIKGLVRSVFPGKEDRNIIAEKCAYFKDCLGLDDEINAQFLKKLESQIFEEKGDIFHDAYIIPPKHGKIFAEDYITPHTDFEDPTPLRHLKIATGVSFCFQFQLKNNRHITKSQKLDLFKQIILDFGLGAKTNSGYGIFQEVKK